MSARELLDAVLARVDRLDEAINAVVTIDAERAHAEAAAIDERRARGEHVGQLAGVPITIKDAIGTRGIRSTGGAVELGDHVPDVDAPVVERVRGEGAVVFGKTNAPRWSADYQSYNDLFGTTNNPWDPARTPGGSSGGAAAAVAMGFTGFEIGTDIGGSIRLPASFCGVFGHKPTFGVVPTFGYLDHPTWHRAVADNNVFGPIGRSIDDVELLFDLLVSPDPDDAVGWRLDLPPARATDLADFRVAAWLDDPAFPVDTAVASVLDAAVARLEDAGAQVDHDARPSIDPSRAAEDGLLLISTAMSVSDSDEDHAAAIEAGSAMTYRDWELVNRRRGETRQRWSAFFADVDVLLCPTTVVPPFPHVHKSDNWGLESFGDHDRPYLELVWWNAMIGSAYLPVTVPPIGRTDGGLPIGIQVVAPYLHDRTALAFARHVSEVLGGYVPPPAAR